MNKQQQANVTNIKRIQTRVNKLHKLEKLIIKFDLVNYCRVKQTGETFTLWLSPFPWIELDYMDVVHEIVRYKKFTENGPDE